MEIKGKIVRVMEVQTGGSGNKPWHKQEFVLEQPGQYPKNVCICLWGEEQINKYDLQPGLTVTAHINIESREYNGRWYTDVRAWKLEWDKQQTRNWQSGGSPGKAGSAAGPDEPEKAKPVTSPDLGSGPLDSDLPF